MAFSRRLAPLLCCGAGLHVALAMANDQQSPGTLQTFTRPPSGYAFSQPEVLKDQIIWGIAHGVRLLGQACARAGHGAAAESANRWQEREAGQVRRAQQALARYYFGQAESSAEAVAGALGLKAEIDAREEVLEPACATLAEALAQPRYDLARRRAQIVAP